MRKTAVLLSVLILAVSAFTTAASCNGGSNQGGNTGSNGKAMSVQEVKDALENAKSGDKITMGHWEQDGKNNGKEPISWTVICEEVGKALVLADQVLEYKPFQNTPEGKDSRWLTAIWPESDARTFLEEDFYKNAFSDEERALIYAAKHTIYYYEDYQPTSKESTEHVFFLSVEEYSRYVLKKGALGYGVPTASVQKLDPHMSEISGVEGIKKAMGWWLRDVGDSIGKAVDVPGYELKPDTYGYDVSGKRGYRPAMWIVYNEKDLTAYEKGEIEPKEDAELNARLKAAKVGDILTFGSIDLDPRMNNGFEDIEWQVLEADETTLLLFCTHVVASERFVSPGRDTKDANWAISDLRKMLNDPSLLEHLFSQQERAKILLSRLNTPDSTGSWVRDGGGDTEDYLYIPSRPELEQYFPNEADRICRNNQDYWVRTPEFVEPYMTCVRYDGAFSTKDGEDYCGVRLMMRIKR